MKLPTTLFPVATSIPFPSMKTPLALPEITLRSPAPVPPTTFPEAPRPMATPSLALPRRVDPSAPSPIVLPAIVFRLAVLLRSSIPEPLLPEITLSRIWLPSMSVSTADVPADWLLPRSTRPVRSVPM